MDNSAEIHAAEDKVDQGWRSTPLPKNELDQCLYQLFTHSEDLQRFAIMSSDLNAYISIHDGIKYALRTALLLVSKQASAVSDAPFSVDWVAYKASSNFLEVADRYEAASLAFALFWKKAATCTIKDDTFVFTPTEPEGPHVVLDLIVSEHMTPPPLETIIMWLTSQTRPPPAVQSIKRTTIHLPNGRLDYSFVPKLAYQLSQQLPKGTPLLPPAWKAWDVPSGTLRRILHALRVRCAYHLLAINQGAGRFRIQGGGVDDLLLIMSGDALQDNIVRLLPEDASAISEVIRVLTYGTGTETPDPALQPIIPLRDDLVALPCHFILASSLQRNLLTLQARVRRTEFDAQSHLFEEGMLQDIRKLLRTSSLVWRDTIGSKGGEIDLVLGQQGSSVLVILELKWFIPAGDRDEVQHRRKAVTLGASQLRKKCSAVLRDLEHFKTLLGLTSPIECIQGAVVCEGFTYPTTEPCIPFSIVKKLLRERHTLTKLADFIKNQPWLPIEGEHFNTVPHAHELGGVTFSWPGYQLTPKAGQIALTWSGT